MAGSAVVGVKLLPYAGECSGPLHLLQALHCTILQTRDGSGSPITDLASQPCGSLVACCHCNGFVAVWDVSRQVCNLSETVEHAA